MRWALTRKSGSGLRSHWRPRCGRRPSPARTRWTEERLTTGLDDFARACAKRCCEQRPSSGRRKSLSREHASLTISQRVARWVPRHGKPLVSRVRTLGTHGMIGGAHGRLWVARGRGFSRSHTTTGPPLRSSAIRGIAKSQHCTSARQIAADGGQSRASRGASNPREPIEAAARREGGEWSLGGSWRGSGSCPTRARGRRPWCGSARDRPPGGVRGAVAHVIALRAASVVRWRTLRRRSVPEEDERDPRGALDALPARALVSPPRSPKPCGRRGRGAE